MCAFQSTISNIRIKLVNFALIIEVSASSSRKMKMVNHNVNHKTIELINSLKNKEKIRILFVCLGNICRSPAAQGILQACINKHGDTDAWIIDSAGTGGWHVGDLPDNRMRIHAQWRGYTLDHICRQVRDVDFDNFDILIGMDANNVAKLKHMAPTIEAQDKVVPMIAFVQMPTRQDCIPDPYYDGDDGFENVLTLLEDGCTNLAKIIRE